MHLSRIVEDPINPFFANFPILYSLKTTENQRFSGVFREYEMETLARYGLSPLPDI